MAQSILDGYFARQRFFLDLFVFCFGYFRAKSAERLGVSGWPLQGVSYFFITSHLMRAGAAHHFMEYMGCPPALQYISLASRAVAAIGVESSGQLTAGDSINFRDYAISLFFTYFETDIKHKT